ncbi:ATP-binding protein [Mycolicibacterium sp.]|uniref:ATP-binding protein n=1 Tax=Mycolicibacterium sp. TaxID=2320850 RepID=UPI003D0BA8D3
MTNPEVPRVLETITGPDTLEAIQGVLDDVWASREVPELVRMHTELAVSEIAANIIEHSGDGQPVRLRMHVEVSADAVAITFTDNGRPAPVDMTQLSMPDDMAERGRGLAIAFRVLDELSYRRDRDGNHWTLIRRRHASE